jgi:uncharacterized protein (TIGR00369 family)
MSQRLDYLRSVIRDGIPWAPIAEFLELRLVAAEYGLATVIFNASTRHANPMGTLHGGVLCDIADAAMGLAYSTTLQAEESFATLEQKTNFLKPVWQGTLSATGRVVKGGRTVGLVECDIVNDKRILVARASSTCMTLRGDAAARRTLSY